MHIFRRSVMLFLVIVMVGAMAVSAAGFEYSPVPDPVPILEAAGFTWLEEPPRKFAIQCFDVNADGLIAIGTQKGETKIISVYDSHGGYRYGFSCQDRGDFGLEWEGDDILVYSVRSDLAFRVNPAGEVEEVREILNTEENYAHWRQEVSAAERSLGTDRYYLRNNMGILNILGASYSQLVVAHGDGTEEVLYDVNSELLMIRIAWLLFAILFVWIVVSILVRQIRKQRQDCPQDR